MHSPGQQQTGLWVRNRRPAAALNIQWAALNGAEARAAPRLSNIHPSSSGVSYLARNKTGPSTKGWVAVRYKRNNTGGTTTSIPISRLQAAFPRILAADSYEPDFSECRIFRILPS